MNMFRNKGAESERQRETLARIRARKFSRAYLLILVLLVSILFYNIISIFVVPILLAAVFTALFYPLYAKLNDLFKNRSSLASVTACFTLLLGLLVPMYFVIDLVSREAIVWFQTGFPKLKAIIEQGDAGILGQIKTYPILNRVNWDQIDWQNSLQDIIRNAGAILTTVLNKTSRGTFQVITDVFITLFTMFYFFRDGHKLIAKIKYLSPLDDVHEDELFNRFVSVSRATIKGTLLIGIAQGSLGALTLWIFGVKSPMVWGVVMVILSVIPLVGGWLVLYPAAAIEIISGDVWQGIAILIITIVVIGNVDNLLRPRLVGRDAGMHDLVIFFSTLGGLSVFGIMGFIIGPVIAVFFLTLLDIYSIEFKTTLDLAQGGILQESPEPSESQEESETV